MTTVCSQSRVLIIQELTILLKKYYMNVISVFEIMPEIQHYMQELTYMHRQKCTKPWLYRT